MSRPNRANFETSCARSPSCSPTRRLRDLALAPIEVQTPLASSRGVELTERIGLVPILRAGLGMVNGIWELMPQAEVWHIGLYRDERTLKPVEYYNKLPVPPTVQVVLILDPMLATGGSAVATVDMLKRWGAGRIKYLGIIGAPEGVKALSEAHPDVDIYLAALDDHLTPEPQKPAIPRRFHRARPGRCRRSAVRNGPVRLRLMIHVICSYANLDHYLESSRAMYASSAQN